jgi:anti-anti-sigma regulatory factor
MLRAVTERSLTTGVTTTHLAGSLMPATMSACRRIVGKAAAECPVAVIVDLAGLDHAETRALSVFATATSEAQQRWGVPVLLCEPDAEIRRGLETVRRFVAVYDHHWQAVLAVRSYVPRWVWERFAPLPESAAGARSLIGEACLTWGLPRLRDTARLVASEMAANAIQHAATDFEVMAGYSGCCLRIAVRDGSKALPALVEAPRANSSIMAEGSGRGMRIIAAAGTHCGVTLLPDGKIFWVLLDVYR